MKNNITIIISAISLLMVGYLAYYQTVIIPNKLQKCHEIAVGFEKARHIPIDDLNVTNQDISGYLKNIVSCFSDK
jgi:hypothetical protein